MPPNPHLTVLGRSESPKSNQNSQLHHSDGEMQHIDKIEDIWVKLPAKTKLGFPPSDGIGCLQIIKNNDLEELGNWVLAPLVPFSMENGGPLMLQSNGSMIGACRETFRRRTHER